MVQSAEGAMQEMHEVVQRGNELAIKAANGTLSDDDRKMIDEEIQQLKESLNETAGKQFLMNFEFSRMMVNLQKHLWKPKIIKLYLMLQIRHFQ